MAEMQYFEELKASLEEAVAYKKGIKAAAVRLSPQRPYPPIPRPT